ncbi:hypothetical protein EDB85DRAFT_1898569 [Lactarius pseudohatsudake]|nr:hypothetical protein EDB85DRAFT_1898569 [Lactarius pseudohatsudake]
MARSLDRDTCGATTVVERHGWGGGTVVERHGWGGGAVVERRGSGVAGSVGVGRGVHEGLQRVQGRGGVVAVIRVQQSRRGRAIHQSILALYSPNLPSCSTLLHLHPFKPFPLPSSLAVMKTTDDALGFVPVHQDMFFLLIFSSPATSPQHGAQDPVTTDPPPHHPDCQPATTPPQHLAQAPTAADPPCCPSTVRKTSPPPTHPHTTPTRHARPCHHLPPRHLNTARKTPPPATPPQHRARPRHPLNTVQTPPPPQHRSGPPPPQHRGDPATPSTPRRPRHPLNTAQDPATAHPPRRPQHGTQGLATASATPPQDRTHKTATATTPPRYRVQDPATPDLPYPKHGI